MMKREEGSYKIILSKHSESRIRQRAGISKKSALSNAVKAYQNGITHRDTKGSLNRYLGGIAYRSHKGTSLRVYNDYVYIFMDENHQDSEGIFVINLVTMYHLPANLVTNARKKQKQLNPQEEV